MNRLQCVQNVSAKLVSGNLKFDHVTPILRELHWLPVEYRTEYKCTLLTWKAVNGCAPQYLQDLIHFRNTRAHRSKDQRLLEVPRTNLVTGGDRCFSKYAPILWNNLPAPIRNVTEMSTFKSQLKTNLFRKAFVDN